MIDPSMMMAAKAAKTVVLPDTTSLGAAKTYLHNHGFDNNFGSQETVDKFNEFAQGEVDQGSYAGKSLKLGEGGRAALLRHQLIISGKFGNSLEEITPENWKKINDIIEMNYMKKYGGSQ